MGKDSKPKKHKILYVVWNDAESIDEWTFGHSVDHSTAEVHSIGFLLSENPEAITLALNHDKKNDSYSCMMKIPTGMIISKKIVKS